MGKTAENLEQFKSVALQCYDNLQGGRIKGFVWAEEKQAIKSPPKSEPLNRLL